MQWQASTDELAQSTIALPVEKARKHIRFMEALHCCRKQYRERIIQLTKGGMPWPD